MKTLKGTRQMVEIGLNHFHIHAQEEELMYTVNAAGKKAGAWNFWRDVRCQSHPRKNKAIDREELKYFLNQLAHEADRTTARLSVTILKRRSIQLGGTRPCKGAVVHTFK